MKIKQVIVDHIIVLLVLSATRDNVYILKVIVAVDPLMKSQFP